MLWGLFANIAGRFSGVTAEIVSGYCLSVTLRAELPLIENHHAREMLHPGWPRAQGLHRELALGGSRD